MKRFFLLLVSFFIGIKSFSQARLTSYIYWFDNDLGNSISANISPTFNYNLNSGINTDGLRIGVHVFNIQFADDSSKKSSVLSAFFYKSNANISEYEYWFDDNYAVKINQSVPANQQVSFSKAINVDSLKAGYHVFHIRVKDLNDSWSLAQSSYFIKLGGNSTGEVITAFRYWLDNDPATMAVVPINTPASIVQINDPLDVLSHLGTHTINIQFKDNAQLWTAVTSHSFLNCPGVIDPLNSDFNFAAEGTDVSFINTSSSASSYLWKFDDGDTSNIANPLHHYPTTPAAYNICLISSNSCLQKIDTICKTFSVRGLRAINTNHGGNNGPVSTTITGGGFITGTQLFLHKNGEQDITGDTLIIHNEGLMRTTFDFSGKALGLWDVIVVFPDNRRDTLHNGFTVEIADTNKLWVNITGSEVLRIGFNQVYTVTYGNDGNTDAVFVPLIITGLLLGTDIELLNPLFKIDSLPIFESLHFSTDSFPHTIHDTLNQVSFRGVFIGKIPANSTGTLNFIFHVPLTTPPHTLSEIQVIIGEPIAGAYHQNTQRSQNDQNSRGSWDFYKLAECGTATANLAGSLILDVLQFNDWKTCAIGSLGIFSSLANSFIDAVEGSPSNEPFLDMVDFSIGTTETTVSCLEAAIGTFLPETKIVKLVRWGVTAASYEMMDFEVADKCSEVYKPAAKTIKPVDNATAGDPNEKYGVGDSSKHHYTNAIPLSYDISFENGPQFNINVQTAIVIDSLSANYYDYQSFRFTSIVIGDSIFNLSNPAKSFYHDFDFTGRFGIKARVTAAFDTITGVAIWKFLTIDPVTNQVTTNALTGFLPPDILPPEGQGHVSFTVSPKSNILTGDTVSNKAMIIFDYNQPIITNDWVNTFDFVKPTSNVQALPITTKREKFAVKWSGNDNLSGIRNYKIYTSVNDSAFTLWKITKAISDTFSGAFGNKYSFYSIATDNAGNIEPVKNTGEATTFVTLSVKDSICNGSNASFGSDNIEAGNTYQWQLSAGAGFNDLINSGVYAGVTSDTLKLTSITSAYAGYKYRCIITNAGLNDTSFVHELHFVNKWTGTVNNAWENTSNWSCNSLPDANTDVVIEESIANSPIVNSTNATCRSLLIGPGSTLTVNPGFKITVTH